MQFKRKIFDETLNSEKYHSDVKKHKFSKNLLICVNKDKKIPNIIKNISNYISKYFRLYKNYGGEWEFLNKKKRSNYLSVLKKNKLYLLYNNFLNFFVNDTSYGICTPSYADLTRYTKSQILFDIDAAKKFANLKNLSQISYNKNLGNCYGLVHNHKIILPDSPRHYYFAKKIINLLKKKNNLIIEIGGGYGGLAKILRILKFNHTYIGVDLIETLLIQYYFLRASGLKVKIINKIKDLNVNQINLLPYNFANSFLKTIESSDIIFNSRSFSELNLKVLKNYFHLINNYLKPKYIYHENSDYLLFPKSKRHIEILSSKFPIDPANYTLTYSSSSPFLGGGGRYKEFLYKRN